MLVGEGPGKMEASIGRPFCGVSGLELNRYLLMQAGLRRQDCYITNVVKYRTDEDNSDPTPEDLERDGPILLEEISQVKPSVICPVGRIAAEWFLGPVSMEFDYAVPRWSDKFNATIFPLYHPAAGLHQADKYSKFVYNGFKRLGAYLNGTLQTQVDDIQTNYTEYTPYVDTIVAVDTEGYPEAPWGLSYSHFPGTAYVGKHGPFLNCDKIIFHNATWDLKVLRALGVEVPYDKIEDTMIQAHLLCLEPKKLKALAYREAGMEMEEYKDVIKEADENISKGWLLRVVTENSCHDCKGLGKVVRPYKKNPNKFTKPLPCATCLGDGTTFPRPESQLVFNDDFTAAIYTPESIGRRLRGILESGHSYRDKWNDTDSSLKVSVEAKCGVMPNVSLDDVEPRQRVINYSARDADATLRVYHRLSPRIQAAGLQRAYEIDLGCIPIIDRMHQNGILIDKEYFKALDKQFETQQYEVLDKLYSAVGSYFNPSSPVQIKEILGKYGVKDLESSKERDLQLLLIKQPELKPIIENGLLYRTLNKMRGNYTTKLAAQADENSRLHTTFILSAQEGNDSAEAPSTGRLSSRGPNLQNIPVAAEGPGSLIRKGFIAAPGKVLLSCDLSQIELRVGAHLAKEEAMMEAFHKGLDLHTYTAAKMFGVPYDKVDKKTQRYPAKSINFGIFYGMSKYRLQSELAVVGITISLNEAQEFIDAWFGIYPGMRNYMFQVQSEARQNYFVRTLFGHIRYLPNVHSKDPRVQAEALRQAGNHGVQGSAGEILKIAMANIHKKVYPVLQSMGYFEPLLSIHDEVIFEVDEQIADIAEKMVAYEMEHAVELDVPLLSSSKTAKTWADLKD
jgi:uracil-DNA glycosylase family 4